MRAAFLKSTDYNPVNEFRELADAVVTLCARYEVQVRSYANPELPLFSALSPAAQEKALRGLRTYLASLKMVEDHDEDLRDDQRSLWYALSTLGLLPPSQLFSLFKSGEVIEIYDMEGFQIWRNFNFLKICSYTLEEMYSIEWHRRYRRSSEKSQECLEKIGLLMSQKSPEIYNALIGEHILEETESRERLMLSARHDWLIRLNDRAGIFSAWMGISTVEILKDRRLEPSIPEVSPSL